MILLPRTVIVSDVFTCIQSLAFGGFLCGIDLYSLYENRRERHWLFQGSRVLDRRCQAAASRCRLVANTILIVAPLPRCQSERIDVPPHWLTVVE